MARCFINIIISFLDNNADIVLLAIEVYYQLQMRKATSKKENYEVVMVEQSSGQKKIINQ